MRILVNIDVPAIAPAVAFYCSALGLELRRMVSDDVAELAGAQSTIYLLCRSEGSDSSGTGSEPRRYARHWTPVHVDFVVDDIAMGAQQAIRAGAVQQSQCTDWNGSRCITFSDPFGHGFCLIEFAADTYVGNEP